MGVPLIVILALLLVAFMVYASYSISSGVYVKAFCKKRTTDKIVALTFDDGPHPENTPKVLDILAEWEVEAAFFCIGKNVEAHPEIVERMFSEGHLVGNHSYSHCNSFPLMGVKKMVEDIRKTDELIANVTGSPVHFFRPPFGITNPLVRDALSQFNYNVIGWNVRSFDTMSASVDEVYRRVIKQIKPGSVILLHDRLSVAPELLSRLLRYLSDEGYEVRRVDKLFNIFD
ncbi:MAG: polysaccharide deacetylase family protein [Paludibacteraceae bacterium]|nr:polysaccharide deacetylase family protein [Paludibacteraceae bacterium]